MAPRSSRLRVSECPFSRPPRRRAPACRPASALRASPSPPRISWRTTRSTRPPGTVVNDRSGNGQPRGDRQQQRDDRLEQRARPDAAGRQRRDRRPRSGCRTRCCRAEQRDDRLRRPALEHDAAGAGVRVRPDGRQRRLPDRDAGRRHHPPLGVDRRARARARSPQTATAPAALAANTFKHVAVTIKGGDALTPGQMLLYEDGVAGRLQHRADAQALRHRLGDRASSAARATRPGSSSAARIKDFRIYSKELTASQVLALSDDDGAGQPGRAEGLGRPRATPAR